MPSLEDYAQTEYSALMRRGQDAERNAHLCWTAGGLTAAVMLSWAITAKSPGLMIPVLFAIAIGFYTMLRQRQQVRSIASYIAVFCEDPKGPQWFTRLQRAKGQPAYRASGDWLAVCLANAAVLLTLMLAWMYADGAARGDLMAGIVTGCGVAFGFHSISETIRMEQTDWSALWAGVSGDLQEAPRAKRAASW